MLGSPSSGISVESLTMEQVKHLTGVAVTAEYITDHPLIAEIREGPRVIRIEVEGTNPWKYTALRGSHPRGIELEMPHTSALVTGVTPFVLAGNMQGTVAEAESYPHPLRQPETGAISIR